MHLGTLRTFMNFNSSLLICVSRACKAAEINAMICISSRYKFPRGADNRSRYHVLADGLRRSDTVTGALFEELWYSISHQWQTLLLCHKNNDNGTDFIAVSREDRRSKWPHEFGWIETVRGMLRCGLWMKNTVLWWSYTWAVLQSMTNYSSLLCFCFRVLCTFDKS